MLIGFGLAGCSFPMVIGALGKLVPENWRALCVRRRHGGGLVRPVPLSRRSAHALIDSVLLADRAAGVRRHRCCWCCRCRWRWRRRRARRSPARRKPQSSKQALVEAFGHRSYVLLVLGFFTCGFQLAFVTVHLPSYLVDRGLGADIGAWTIAFIGLFNIVGSLGSGWLSGRMPKRYLLSIIYFCARAFHRRLHRAAGQHRRRR